MDLAPDDRDDLLGLKRLALAAMLLLSGCSTVSYYYQAVRGQVDLLERRRPIEQVIADSATPEKIRGKLQALLAMRDFASHDLGLPDNRSYRTYADLGRPYVLWNVFAAAEFSTELERWCFPIAGCVDYRGYFDREAARAYARELAEHGADVYVGGVPAYSTLGWFDDPVLSTFIHYPEPELARLLFHELGHQVVYVKDDSMFNESFATAVEEEGMARWAARDPSGGRNAGWEAARRRRSDFQALVLDIRRRLAEVYGSARSVEEKRVAKRAILDDMQASFVRLSQAWGGSFGYERWFAEKPNNAQLASVAIYTALVPSFRAVFAAQGNDFGRFYREVRRIAALPKPERDAALEAVLQARPQQQAGAGAANAPAMLR